MPRYIVKYTKPEQVEGARIFDIPNGASADDIHDSARATAGDGATVVSVEPNDQSPIGEWPEGQKPQ